MTAGTYNFVVLILNSNPVGGLLACIISAKTHYLDQFKINSISQLINGVSQVFQKLRKCLSRTKILVLFLPTLFGS